MTDSTLDQGKRDLPEAADMPRIMDERDELRACINCGHSDEDHCPTHDATDHRCGVCACQLFVRERDWTQRITRDGSQVTR